MYIRNKKIAWAFLVGVCFLGKGESSTFSGIVENGGLPRCLAVAANTARNYTFIELENNFAWRLDSVVMRCLPRERYI
jgi:hypothetical protein